MVRLGDFEVALVLERDPADLEGIGNDAALRGADLVLGLASHEYGKTNKEHEEGKKVGGPETDVLLQLCGRDGAETADVDHHVEEHVCIYLSIVLAYCCADESVREGTYTCVG